MTAPTIAAHVERHAQDLTDWTHDRRRELARAAVDHAARTAHAARRAELLHRAGRAIVLAVIGGLALAVLVLLVLAWAATGDDRLGWLFGGMVALELAAYVILVATDGGAR